MKIEIVPFSQKRTPADLLVAGFFEKDKLSRELRKAEPDFVRTAQKAVEKGRFTGKFGQVFSSCHSAYQEAPEIVLLGLGSRKDYKPGCLRKAVGQVIGIAKERRAGKVRIVLESMLAGAVNRRTAAEIAAEISLLASYAFDKYKSKKQEDAKEKGLESLELLTMKPSGPAGDRKAIEQGQISAEGVLLARNLVNEPGNIMNAGRLAEEAEKLAARKKISCKILGPEELKRLKMNGILAVNQGSVTPPRLIVLEYGQRFKSKGTVCLVGKGVTFDTGGISIKPAKDMEKMKYDMAGAACVIAAMGVVADLKLSLHVVALAPAVENNVAENPQRPGDIITMSNGKTVEVLNTDAEGRLILADALVYSAQYKPKAIIDVATLTGMCVYTFSDKAIGLMGNDNRLLERVMRAGEVTGEKCWQLPLWSEYGEQLKGHHSDLYNIGGPYAGTITAAMFLKEFVPEKTPWVHLDIAGTAWCDSKRYDCAKGATGVGVRLLTQLLVNWK